MSPKTNEIAKMIDMLPVTEQDLAYEFVKRLVLAWDSDFTKTTALEAEQIEQAKQGEFIDSSDIDWNNLSKYSN